MEDAMVTEIELDDAQLDTWIERLRELKEGADGTVHVHLEYEGGEVLVHLKE